MLEEIYQLVRHCGISKTEAYAMPIVHRKWWIQRRSRDGEAQQQQPAQEFQSTTKGERRYTTYTPPGPGAKLG